MTTPHKKIAYVSGTRADFGLMVPVLRATQNSPNLSLQLYITGIHLMPEFGETAEEVLKEFPRAKKIHTVFESDDQKSMAKFTGVFLSDVVSAFEQDKPDFVLILGDRPEMLMVASACLYLGIPTGQLHAGDRSSTVDEVARHAITKLSSLLFPATEDAAARIKKMGEEEWRIHIVGAPALDVILHEPLPSPSEVSDFLKLSSEDKFILITMHPVSETWKEASMQIRVVLESVKAFNIGAVILFPHADAGGRSMIVEIEKEKHNPLFRIHASVPHRLFLALARDAAVWVGNSSAIMIESSSFKTPCVNVGARQNKRERGLNVINVGYDQNEITSAIHKSLFDADYLEGLKHLTNPWGDGKTASKVLEVLENLPPKKKLLAKQIVY